MDIGLFRIDIVCSACCVWYHKRQNISVIGDFFDSASVLLPLAVLFLRNDYVAEFKRIS